MKFTRLLLGIFTLLPLLALAAGCGGGGGGGGDSESPLVSITVTPANSTIAAGGTLQFSAVGTYANGKTADLTAAATWSSSVEAVASVNNAAGSKGAVTGVAAGSTAIIAMVGTVSGSANVTVTGAGAVSPNVMTITVNGSLCSDSSYLNKPCVSVTICNPGSTTCRTIPDILLDTGSYGLRIFKDTIPDLTLAQVPSGSGSLAECVQFADGSSLWGPVQVAGVKLGNEPVVEIPVQVVDASFGTRPNQCQNADLSRQSARFNGILGVGISTEDCGPICVSNPGIGLYYRCSGANCSGTAVALASQVQNPVPHLPPQDNNGIIVQLPAVPFDGVVSTSGSLIFGIGTRPNNTPASPTVFPTDEFGDFRTVYNGVNSTSFLDTGSNGLYFPNVPPELPTCPDPDSGWYCPPVTRELFATTVGAFGSPSATVPFYIGNLLNLANSPNNVFKEIGGTSTFGFDWGLPFFLGRQVFFGMEGKASSLGTGPYVAY
ncbi:MAG: hypothetical protein A2075_05000 [Geobacteraceae bacterium GWC2_58_44]|nr:MAG: hypothetical protein A2075_05000 [Geobacteraceae bacterium GWC2_58_44]HBG07260.1 hypothetical protein [Geobacter sp.]